MNLEETISSDDTNLQLFKKEFKIYKNVSPFFLQQHPFYVQEGIVFLCVAGEGIISVFTREETVKVNDLVVIMPGDLVCLRSAGDDFRVNCFIIGNPLFNDMLGGVCRFSPGFYLYIRDHFLYSLNSREELLHFKYLFQLLYKRANSKSSFSPRMSIIYLLRILYLDFYNNYRHLEENVSNRPDKRKEELAMKFFNLMVERYKYQKDVAYYARLLSISSKYLTTLVKGICGRSAKECISEYTLAEIKMLLKNTSLDIHEIALRTNFCNQSALGRFFKQHTGITPSAYRLKE